MSTTNDYFTEIVDVTLYKYNSIDLKLWGIIQRKSFKYDMLSASILHQVCSAYAAAKMQGKGAVGAMQNLGEMRIRAKSMQEKEKAAKKKK